MKCQHSMDRQQLYSTKKKRERDSEEDFCLEMPFGNYWEKQMEFCESFCIAAETTRTPLPPSLPPATQFQSRRPDVMFASGCHLNAGPPPPFQTRLHAWSSETEPRFPGFATKRPKCLETLWLGMKSPTSMLPGFKGAFPSGFSGLKWPEVGGWACNCGLDKQKQREQHICAERGLTTVSRSYREMDVGLNDWRQRAALLEFIFFSPFHFFQP